MDEQMETLLNKLGCDMAAALIEPVEHERELTREDRLADSVALYANRLFARGLTPRMIAPLLVEYQRLRMAAELRLYDAFNPPRAGDS